MPVEGFDAPAANRHGMTKKIVLLAVALFVALAALPAGAASYKTLGTDPELDAAPSFDLTELSVRKAGKDLEIRIGISGMVPPWGIAVPYLPGVQWAFDVKGRTFVAEAYTDPTAEPGFILFEKKGDAFTQLAELKGTYSWEDGFASIRVPLKKIGAKSGTRISGAGKVNDVDFHIHAGPVTEYADYLTTKKDFIVP
jgi:hypothetical protein